MAAVGSEQQLRFRWNDHMQHVSKILTLQRLEEQFCDVSLVSEDGFVMKAHQAILASTSAYFQRVLSEVTSDQHPMIVLRGANFREMSCLLDYMYQGNTQVDQSLMESVLEVADMLEVKGLSRIRSNATIKKFMVPCASPSSTNGSSLHMPCTDNIRGGSRDEEQFYRGNQADTRTSDTEGARMRLTSNICENRSSRENPHLSADGPPMSHAQPHSSRHESDPQDDEDVTQTSGIDLSLAKNEPWSPREGGALLGPKDDSDDEELSPSKKKRKHQENLCSEETLDPVSDPDWGRIGTKLEERPCHKPRTISLSSVTTVDAGQMSGLLNDDEWTDEDTAIPGPAEALRPISAPPILPVNKHRPLPDSLVTNHAHTSLPPSPDFLVINHSHAASSSSSLSVPSASITCTQRLAKYPQSHSHIQPFLSNLEPVPAIPQNISVRSSPQHTPISDSLKNGSVDDQNTQNAIADPEQFSDEENLDSAHDMFQTSIVKKGVSDGAKTSFVRQANQESQTAYKNLQPALRNCIQSSLLSSECIQSSVTQRNKNKISSASKACLTVKKECPSDLDSRQSLEGNIADNSVVRHMNTIKQEHQEETLKSNIKACSFKTDKGNQTRYVEIRLNEGKFKSKFPVPDLSMNNKEENGEDLNNMNENHPPKEEEPLCPLEKKMKRPRSTIKRPMNQYMLFQKEMRKKLRAQHPEESNQRIAVWLGYLWRQLPLSEKAKWQARADYVKKEHKRLYPYYSYNPREASEKRKEYITTLTERRNLYRIKPQENTEEN